MNFQFEADVVVDPLRGPEGREVEPGEVVHEVAQLGLERLDLAVGQVEEHEPLPGGRVDRPQPERLEAEVLEVLGVLGPDEPAVEVVDPGVVGALEADGGAALPLLDRGATVAAHVVERADHVVLAAHEQQLLAVEVEELEAAGRRDVLDAGGHHPVGADDALALPVQDRLVVVAAGGQERGAPVLAPDAIQLVGGEDGYPGHRVLSCLPGRWTLPDVAHLPTARATRPPGVLPRATG